MINDGSLIDWHGGTRQSDEIWKAMASCSDKEDLMKFVVRLREKEEAFFEYIDVDPDITVYGQTSLNKCQIAKATDEWYYSTSDLVKMGVPIDGELASSLEYEGETIAVCLMPDFKDI